MKKLMVFSRGHRRHLLISVFLVLLSLLLVGAVKVTAGFTERRNNCEIERERINSLLSSISREIPVEFTQEWGKNAQNDPYFYMFVNTEYLSSWDR